ncbi:uncharacterized protein LOC144075946 [Stigmatopora argus]
MAPLKLSTIERQTFQIIQQLFAEDDVDGIACRQFSDQLETDGPLSEEDHFDPVPIAATLRGMADSMNQDPQFQASLSELKIAFGQEVVDGAFGRGVDALLQTQISQRVPDAALEEGLIKVSIAFGLYLKESWPELKTKIQCAMTTFLQSRVTTWVIQQGGWEKVSEDIGNI